MLLFTRRPLPFRAPPISSRIAGSSIVAGMVQGSPSAVFFMVPRRILPERVFGSRATVIIRRCDQGESLGVDALVAAARRAAEGGHGVLS
jgi:hypothetical protein